MNFLEADSISTLPSDLQNPFKVEGVIRIAMFMMLGLFDNTPYWTSTIEFKRGNTSGKQEFKGTGPVDLLKQMEAFCKQLK